MFWRTRVGRRLIKKAKRERKKSSLESLKKARFKKRMCRRRFPLYK